MVTEPSPSERGRPKAGWGASITLGSYPVNSHGNLLVFFAVGCVALPRVVHATGATAGRPYTSSRLADDEKSCASYHAN